MNVRRRARKERSTEVFHDTSADLTINVEKHVKSRSHVGAIRRRQPSH